MGQTTLKTTVLSWGHSPLTVRTSCLKMLGGDMMTPVGRAEKAAGAEGSPQSTGKPLSRGDASSYDLKGMGIRQAWSPAMKKEEGHD